MSGEASSSVEPRILKNPVAVKGDSHVFPSASSRSNVSERAADDCEASGITGGVARLKHLWRLSCPPYLDDRDWDKSDVSDLIHWVKQFIAIILGILFGIVGVTGWIGYVIVLVSLYGACNTYLNVVKIPDTTMTYTEGFQEGLMPALMTFTLFWVVTNSVIRG